MPTEILWHGICLVSKIVNFDFFEFHSPLSSIVEKLCLAILFPSPELWFKIQRQTDMQVITVLINAILYKLCNYEGWQAMIFMNRDNFYQFTNIN